MKPRTYNYIERLVNRITRKSQSLNDSFTYYRRKVTLQSCMRNFCVVIITEVDDRGFGNTLEFDVDFDTKKVHFQSTQCRRMTLKVVDALAAIYEDIRISYDPQYKDELFIQPQLPL